MNAIRATSTQPTFMLLTGEGGRPSSRQSTMPPPSQPGISRESSKENLAPDDAEEYEAQRRQIEQLKADLGTLRYTVTNYESEKEMARLQHESEIRDAQRRADEDFKKKQASEAERTTAMRRVEQLQSELEELRVGQDALRLKLEQRARVAEDEARLLQEQLEDLKSAKDEAARMDERKITDLQSQIITTMNTVHALEQESQGREKLLQATQEKLAENESKIGKMEDEVLTLKAETDDPETMKIIRHDLSEQVQHVRNVEALNQKQADELEKLRPLAKTVGIVENQKASLARQLEGEQALKIQLGEERRQRQRLEDERLSWASYLQSELNASQEEFNSPDAVVRALVQERLESARLLEKLGLMQPEISELERSIQVLEDEKASLISQVENAKVTAAANASDKARMRLERRLAFAQKEIESLRTQLKTYDSEDITFQPENFDESKSRRIQELEDLVDKYKTEVQALHSEISTSETIINSPSQPATGSKRPRTEDMEEEHEQLGQPARKNRKLQDELSNLQTAHQLAQKELSVAQEQLSAAKESSKIRVLSLRNNPTSDFENVKLATLKELRDENSHLRKLINEGDTTSYPVVPMSMLVAMQREVQAAKNETASARKSAQRLKEVWGAKSAEFKEAIFSTLGWHVTFIPNGKMRLESQYHPSLTDEHEHSIVFDGEKGTMKVGGGPRSPFAQKIDNNIKYWVREKGCIPGFLASLTLEFYDEQTGASRSS